MRALLLALCLCPSSSLRAGAALSLTPCDAAPGALVYARPDGSVRSVDGGLCATYAGASPAQLDMQPCIAGGDSTQFWVLNATSSAVLGAPSGGAVLAWNTQGDTGEPRRPVSTWPASDEQWNGWFWTQPDGRLVANCSAPDSCGAPAYCVGAALGRVLSLATVVRYWTVETTRTEHLLNNESALHTVAACVAFRAAAAAGWPGAAVTWAFSWQALHVEDGEYPQIRALVAAYVRTLGDEMTFIPGGYFAPMYNTQAQTSADLHDALALIEGLVGGGYRPLAVIAGFLGAQSLAFLAEEERVHVAQATIFSQYNIDYGDGDGGSPYPYYPSTQHYLKPAQSAADQIDAVVLDGWTVDFLAARRNGFADGFNSRMGVGPIETIGDLGPAAGAAEQLHATAQHFATGAAVNDGLAFVSSIWEISLPINVSYLTAWLAAVRGEWPDAQMLTHGEFGERWRGLHAANDYNLSWVEIGSGIGGSDADKEITFYANRAFRLVLLRNLTDAGTGDVIDLTRYDLPAAEPANLTRSWNLMNVINMKQSRGVVDAPRPLVALSDEDKAVIRTWLPGLPLG
jgi:hypothetical protein